VDSVVNYLLMRR